MSTNITEWIHETILHNNGTVTNTTEEQGIMDRFVEKIYYEVDTFRNSQMIMGTLFLGLVLGMVIMVLCCVRHKSDDYYRVPPPKSVEEVELVRQNHRHKDNKLDEARFEIEMSDDED